MSLKKCPDCGKQVSEHAGACIHCGNPLNAKPVEIVLTKKKWKKWSLVIFAMLFITLILFANQQYALGFMLLFFSWIGAIIIRFGAWWTNG